MTGEAPAQEDAQEDEELPDVRTEDDRRADDELGEDEGLSAQEARERLDRYGANELAESKRSPILEFLSHFWGPIPWLIEGVAVLSAVTGRTTDLVVILFMLVLNGVIGFIQEHKAGNAIEALKEEVASHAQVRRDGDWTEIVAREVVPGDLVKLAPDTVVPADGELLSGTLSVDESALTGESLPVSKEAGDAVYSGSSLARGEGSARVLATGAKTRFGKTAELVNVEAPPSHFQKAVLKIGRYLIVIALVLVGIIIALSLTRGNPVDKTLELALVVAIASIPVALPTVLSATMAAGARLLARHKAIVSRLPALEELAGVEYLLADKTGTITQNQIAVSAVCAYQDRQDDDVLVDAALASDPEGKDPIDVAIFDEVDDERLHEHDIVDFEPFDPETKRAQAHVRGSGGEDFHTAKGAVQAVLELTGAGEDEQRWAEDETSELAADGMRTLAVARSDDGERWELLGVLALRDPPREDAADTLAEAQDLGVEVKMLTGDRVEIGRQIAREVGLDDELLDSDHIRQAADSDELADKIKQVGGFAQVVPEDKYKIADALQSHDHIVGMTGDGVNDTPALRRADVGIAVEGATEAARAASEVVLTSPGLSVIVHALRFSRETFRRMTNYTIYRITETIRVVVFVTITIGILGFFPIKPIQVILLALLNDIAVLSAAYDRAPASHKPARWDMRSVLLVATMMGLTGVISSFLLVYLAHGTWGFDDDTVRTLVYLKLSVAGHLTFFSARTRSWFWTHRPAWIVLAAVIGTQIVATVIALTGFLMPSIGWEEVGIAWGWAFGWLFAVDAAKVLMNRRLARRARDAKPGEAEEATATAPAG